MITAREAQSQSIEVFAKLIPPEYLIKINQEIQKSIKAGSGSCIINTDDVLGKDIKIKIIRSMVMPYLQSLGYRVEVGYGGTPIDIKWF